jgi:O-antigen ligase
MFAITLALAFLKAPGIYTVQTYSLKVAGNHVKHNAPTRMHDNTHIPQCATRSYSLTMQCLRSAVPKRSISRAPTRLLLLLLLRRCSFALISCFAALLQAFSRSLAALLLLLLTAKASRRSMRPLLLLMLLRTALLFAAAG